MRGLINTNLASVAEGENVTIAVPVESPTNLAYAQPILSLEIDPTTDHVIGATEATSVSFIVSGLNVNETATVTFTDADNHKVSLNVSTNGNYSADLSTLVDGTIISSLAGTGPGATTSVSGNAITLDTDHDLTPTLTINAADPAHVMFTVGGLEGDEHGTVTFTDTNARQEMVPIASNGTYSANLSSLATGTISYLLSVSDPAGNVTTLDPTAMLGDGSANAPAGTPQLPNLFAGEAVRPPWMVAGVDYAVGVPAGTTLMDWQNLHGPGISIVGNMVRIDNTSGVHIDGVDFSLHGGAFLLFVNSPGGIVTNSKFQATTPTSLIDTDSNSPGLTVEYCTLIGGADGSGLISAAGNVVIEYNWMKDFPQHAVELGDSTNLTYRYNLIENGGTVAGAHLNYLQETGKGITNSIDIEFNTTYETPSAASGEGFQFDINDTSGNSGTLANPTFAYNTMISTGSGSMSYMVHGSSKYSSSNPIVTPISGTAVAHDNYFDMSGAFGAFYPGSFSGWTAFNNIDMTNGKTISVVDNSETGGSPPPPPPPPPPAPPVISSFSPDTAPLGDGHTTATSITLTGTGEANSTVNVFDGKTSVGHASVDASGAWSLLDSGLTVGAHSFTATDTDANGTSAASATYVVTIDAPTAPPPGGNLVTNGGLETGDFTGWTESGNVAPLSYGPQLFITSSAHSGQDAAGFGSVGSDGTISQNLTTVVGQSYTLDFWLANASGGPNDFTAKIGGVTELQLVNAAAQPYTHYNYTFTATGTSTPLEFDFRQDPSEWHLDDVSVVPTGSVPPPPPAPPAAPAITSFSPDTAPVGDGHTTATSITLTGKGEANSTVNVFDGKTSVGHASVDASGAWSLLDSGLTVGAHSFTATDTDANGTSAASATYVVTIDAPTAPPPGGNLVTNGGFETGDFTGWTESGNVAPLSYGPQLFITSSAHSGQDAAGFGSVGSDGTISQNLTTVVGQSYTLDFWLANASGGPNDFTAKIGGVTELQLVNAAAQPYTHYNYTFTATSTSTSLEFDFRQDPSEWHLDDVSVVPVTLTGVPATSGLDH